MHRWLFQKKKYQQPKVKKRLVTQELRQEMFFPTLYTVDWTREILIIEHLFVMLLSWFCKIRSYSLEIQQHKRSNILQHTFQLSQFWRPSPGLPVHLDHSHGSKTYNPSPGFVLFSWQISLYCVWFCGKRAPQNLRAVLYPIDRFFWWR